MVDQLVLEGLVFQGHIGVTVEERQVLQPIGVDLELDYPDHVLPTIAIADNISIVVDYSRVAARIAQVGCEQECHLLETLAERLCGMLFTEFPMSRVRLWVRKLRPPVKDVHGSVGVRLDRTRADHLPEPAPTRFLMDHWKKFPTGDALDVAAGRGGNSLYLATQGFSVDAIDRDKEALAALAASARERNLSQVMVRSLDLEDPNHPPDLPKERYEVIVVSFYLYRPIFPLLIQALKPSGVLMYETFLIDNHLRFGHPRRREFCLTHNELLGLASKLRVLYYDEGEHENGHRSEPVFTARLLAQKRIQRP